MLSNKKSRLIISLIIAIILWMYVVGMKNPETEKSFYNIPVTFANEQILADDGLAVASIDVESISVTLTGTRSGIGKIKESSITAEVDLANAAVGKNDLSIEVSVPDNIEVSKQSVTKATVRVERATSTQKTVEAYFDGKYSDGEEATAISTNINNVTVSGAQSQVDKVKTVRAVVPENSVTSKKTEITCQLVPVDSDGNKVEHVTLSHDTAKVTAVLYTTKTVPLSLDVVNNSSDGYERTYEAPSEITIKGSKDDISKVDSITANPINISALTSDVKLDITPVLPEGIMVADKSKNLKLEVDVKSGQTSKNFTYSTSSVTTSGLGQGLKATLESTSISVTISGSSKDVSKVDSDDIGLAVNLDGLEAGKHSVRLLVSGPAGITLSASPSHITVNID